MKTIIAASMAMLACSQAHADIKDVRWYMDHPNDLRMTLEVCHSAAQYAQTPTCANAESASAGRMAQNAPNLDALLRDPRYWSLNPIARDGFLLQCRNGTALMPKYCGAAGSSLSQEIGRR